MYHVSPDHAGLLYSGLGRGTARRIFKRRRLLLNLIKPDIKVARIVIHDPGYFYVRPLILFKQYLLPIPLLQPEAQREISHHQILFL